MHPEQIKAEIRMAGTTQAMLADELGIHPASVCLVISGRARSALVQGHIAAIIGKPVDEIWPPKPSLVRRNGGADPATPATATEHLSDINAAIARLGGEL